MRKTLDHLGFPEFYMESSSGELFHENGWREELIVDSKGYRFYNLKRKGGPVEAIAHISIFRDLFEENYLFKYDREFKTLEQFNYPNYKITRDGKLYNNKDRRIGKINSGINIEGNIIFPEGDLLKRIVFENYIEDFPKDTVVRFSDIPKLWNKECEYYKKIIKRKYYLLENYSVVKDIGIWSHRNYKFLKIIKDNREYPICTFYVNSKNFTLRYHNIISDAFLTSNENNYPIVEHLDDNKANFKLSNLKRSTYKENSISSKINGKTLLGENHPASKLTDQQTRTIKSILKMTDRYSVRYSAIAETFKVSKSIIRDIDVGRVRSHITI